MIPLSERICASLTIVLLAMANPCEVRALMVGREPVSLLITAEVSPDNQLHLSLENGSTHPVRLYEHDLPWRSSSPFIVVAVDGENGSVLKQLRPIDDPGTREVVLEPGQRVEGAIPLDQRFPDLVALAKRKEVVVFWAYRPRLLGEGATARSAGWIVIGKSPP